MFTFLELMFSCRISYYRFRFLNKISKNHLNEINETQKKNIYILLHKKLEMCETKYINGFAIPYLKIYSYLKTL